MTSAYRLPCATRASGARGPGAPAGRGAATRTAWSTGYRLGLRRAGAYGSRSVLDGVVDLAQEALSSPWGYVALFAFAAVDAFFPMVPSESLVVTAGVFAASGEPDLALVIVAAGAGALTGDHISYAIGRTAGSRIVASAREGSRRRAAYDWAEVALAERGGLVLIISRYIPGGRTAVTLTMGAVRYDRRAFFLFDALAAISWAIYSAMIGYIGGHAFEEDPLKGLLLGFAIAGAVAIAVEIARHVRKRRAPKPDPEPAERSRELA